ncbi:MAG: prolipoprotein diacylglyceryl transferase [Ruminococcaceae bacterium]|nr:prolipoprotein diacylglyceryl transferase [Oscillospiraceae bacterium]
MVTMSFPGLGIGEFTVNPIAFTLFDKIEVRWYGIIITLGIITAFAYCAYRARQEKILFDDLLDMAIFTVIFGILGARLYYVLTSLDEFESFYEAIAIWEGGLAIYGAIIAGALTVFVMCKIKKISFPKVADAAAPGVMIAQAIGRWGNFFNGEAFGEKVSEDFFMSMGLISRNTNYIFGTSRMVYVHPTFFYESLWNVIGFVLINLVYKKKKFDGQIVLMYLAWYGFGRMLIEGLRTDSLYIGVFRISQVVGFICFVGATAALIVFLVRARRARITAGAYEAAFPKFATTASTSVDTNGNEAEVENSDPADTDISEDTDEAEAEKAEHTDVSEKLEKIFNINTNDKKESDNGADN